MKKTSAALVAIIALALTGCASTPEAAGAKTVAPTIESATHVATDAITAELAKNLPETLGSVADVAETLIENAIKEGQ